MTVNQLEGWTDLCTEAEKLDLLPIASGNEFYFEQIGPGPNITASFPLTDQGIDAAFRWLDSLEDDFYE